MSNLQNVPKKALSDFEMDQQREHDAKPKLLGGSPDKT
jgi:hypothetical protein